MIHSSIESLVDQSQKTNLEESVESETEHKSHHKKHHKHKETNAIQTTAEAHKFISQVPSSSNLVKVDNGATTTHPTLVDVPIDEV
jgi:hypothetical protein